MKTIYSLFVRPNFYYSINLSSFVINNSGASITPYFNQKYGIFTISDISGNLVTNNYVTINSLSGIILFNNDIPIDNYLFNIVYTLNSISISYLYYLNIKPFINYLPDSINLEYNTSNITGINSPKIVSEANYFTNSPIVNNIGGKFKLYDILSTIVLENKISINNLGIISISSNINIGLYNVMITYTFNNI